MVLVLEATVTHGLAVRMEKTTQEGNTNNQDILCSKSEMS